MDQTFKVPIRNLFCLLSYAHQMPELISEMSDVDEEMITIDFLAERFNQQADQLIRRGLVRDYVDKTEETNRLSGRILMNDSLPFIMQHKPVLVCEKDEYSQDILLNKIVKTTLESLYKNNLLSESIRRQSYLIREQLPEVSSIRITREVFFRLSFNRLTYHYRPVIHLARLLFELRLLSHHQGE